MFKCIACDRDYSSQKSLNKHDRIVHHIVKEVVLYKCNYEGSCEEKFSSKRKLQYHYKMHKKPNQKRILENIYQCSECDEVFHIKRKIIRHVKVQHIKSHKRLMCPQPACEEIYNRYKQLSEHLHTSHNISLPSEDYEFTSNADFEKWKAETERRLKANYVRDTSKRYFKDGGLIEYYQCHRSLAPRLVDNCKRNRKSIGTNKIEKACPSRLNVIRKNNKIYAILYPVHMGHAQELGRLRIDEAERHKIAGNLAQGVTVNIIPSDVRENISTSSIEQIHLLEKKDISNIIRDYSIGYSTKRHQNDATSVKLWVTSMTHLENNPILYYKEQGEKDTICEANDFILVIMTEFQANSFIQFGKSKVCIDGTHNLNQYGFQLYTIVVVDDFESGVPVAYCFSNRRDEILFRKFFQCVRDKIGIICTDVFMSDDYPAFYLAWKCVMCEVSRRLLCTWHVNLNWMQNLNKISNKEKRASVSKSLKILQKELDENTFLTQLETFTSQLMADPDTFNFYQYFCRSYLNRKEMWAYCFRKYADINTNMHLESLHKTIKHFYLDGRKCKRLDKTINALMNLVRDKSFDTIIKLEKHKVTEKVNKIRNSHNRGESISRNMIKQNTSNQWSVISSKDIEHTYIVEKISNTCTDECLLRCLKCKICIHNFKCSCSDSIINCNICKHIHACLMMGSVNNGADAEACPREPVQSCGALKNIQEGEVWNLNSKNNRDLLKSKMEVILGLHNKFDLSESDSIWVLKKLDKVIEIYNSMGELDFKIKENVNVNQKIDPQARMFSKKRKNGNERQNIPHPLPFEPKMIKHSLLEPTAVTDIHTGFDHTYALGLDHFSTVNISETTEDI